MKKFLILFVLFSSMSLAFAQDGVTYLQRLDIRGGRPINMHIVFVEPNSDYKVELTYGNREITKLMRVENFAKEADAYAAMNASFFKQDTGLPLGLSIMNGRLMTGPLFQRSAFGIDKHNNCFIERAALEGKISMGQNYNIDVANINQPITSCAAGAYLYNYHWGSRTPDTSDDYFHIVVCKNRIEKISNNPVTIPENGYAIVIAKSFLEYDLRERAPVKYSYKLCPDVFCKVQYAFAGGPNLIIDGKKNIDAAAQKFGILFLSEITARSAIGIKKDGTVILLSVDGRQRGVSEGVNIYELADIMCELGAWQAMNLDGGSSTQMVINKQLVNIPVNRVGARVTNAVVVVKKKRHFFF
ncbi:MAG: phosphodiester glycosidase family protein [bacterium]